MGKCHYLILKTGQCRTSLCHGGSLAARHYCHAPKMVHKKFFSPGKTKNSTSGRNCSNKQISLSKEQGIDLLQVLQRNCQNPAAAHVHGEIKTWKKKDLGDDQIQLLTMTHLSFVTSHHHFKGGIRARTATKLVFASSGSRGDGFGSAVSAATA